MKSLSWIGAVVLVAFMIWMVVACFIPTFRAPEVSKQLYTIRHQDLRDNNALYTDLLLNSIKANDGYLILGTSESNARAKGNYYDFLNADTSIHCGFSMIAGAGRTACTYFPLIQSNANVKGLKVIFFLNPSYGCNKLASSNADYFSRYVSPTLYRQSNNPKNQDVDHIWKINKRNVFFVDRIGDFFGSHVDKLRRKYYQDLRFRIDSTKFFEELSWLDSAKVAKLPKSCNRPESIRYNYRFNVAAGFDVHSYTLQPHPEVSYRCDELRTMIRLCKERGVDIVFVAGPYNYISYAQAHPEELPKIQQVSRNMLRVLDEEGAAYIDCTDLSTVPGVFDDWQHHNSYGAFLIYQKIKDYVLEKEKH